MTIHIFLIYVQLIKHQKIKEIEVFTIILAKITTTNSTSTLLHTVPLEQIHLLDQGLGKRYSLSMGRWYPFWNQLSLMTFTEINK